MANCTKCDIPLRLVGEPGKNYYCWLCHDNALSHNTYRSNRPPVELWIRPLDFAASAASLSPSGKRKGKKKK